MRMSPASPWTRRPPNQLLLVVLTVLAHEADAARVLNLGDGWALLAIVAAIGAVILSQRG